jgi:NAD(P)-dependent dehydrogenase (short-subunit alcohol dehydrogenase family)
MADVVVITGASAGVGRATAHEFARKGARIAILARGADSLAATRRELEQLGAEKVLDIPTDVADANAVEAAADRIERELGPIDVWVNDAMVTIFAPVHEITAEEFRRVTDVTYLGTVHGTMAALKRMRPRDKGAIVQIGSALAYRSIPLQSAYCGAKAAIRGFTDSLRCELIHDKSKITLTMLQLPAVNTPQFDWALDKMPYKVQPLAPIFEPEVIGRAVVYAAYHQRREMYLGWPSVKAIVANKLFPGLLDRILATKAYSGQEVDVKKDADRRDNLFEPVQDKAQTRGRFTDKAKPFSAFIWADMNRLPLAAGALALLAGGIGAYFAWCPELPRFDGKPLRKEWWQRQRCRARNLL